MSGERRYDDDEVRRILDEAARAESGEEGVPAPSAHGLTLAELERIGAEVGLDTGRIRRAAMALDRGGVARRRTVLGIPLGVGTVVPLPRAPDDAEWERLLSEIRATFGAVGQALTHGTTRSWRNGNLQVLVEPGPDGYRLRMRTVKGNAVASAWMAGVGLALAVIMAVVLGLLGGLSEGIVMPVFFTLMAAAALGVNAVTLPSWARRREEQMAYLGERAVAILGGDEGGVPSGDE